MTLQMQTYPVQRQPAVPLRYAESRDSDPFTDHPKILIVDDDPDLVELLKRLFERAGARVVGAFGGEEGLRQFELHHPDLIVLDIMMPDADGWQVCHSLREVSDVPILMLTAMSATTDVTYSLDCGADDYVTKPFEVQILLARARALLRRSAQRNRNGKTPPYDDGYLGIDLDQRLVTVHGKPVRLTFTEYQLLAFLFRGGGQLFSYKEILQHVWDGACLGSSEYVHVYIYRLRKKLEEDPSRPQYLVKEHGTGYRFQPRPAIGS